MGLLSYGADENGYPIFVVPNETVKQQYCNYLEKCYSQALGWRTDNNLLDSYWEKLAFKGDCKPFISYIASIIDDNSSVRDFDAQGEFFVKGFFMSHFCKSSGYVAFTELEAGHGFSDMFLEPLGYKRHAYMIELKYCKKKLVGRNCGSIKRGCQRTIATLYHRPQNNRKMLLPQMGTTYSRNSFQRLENGSFRIKISTFFTIISHFYPNFAPEKRVANVVSSKNTRMRIGTAVEAQIRHSASGDSQHAPLSCGLC